MTRSEVSTPISYPSRVGGTLVTRVLQALGVWQQRRKLAQLDDALLRDIGVSRAEALEEAEKPLWDVPANWLR